MGISERPTPKRLTCRLLAALISLALLAPLAFLPLARGESIAVAEARSQIVRVNLTRLRLIDRLDVTLSAPYTITGASVGLYAEAGSEISVLLREGGLVLGYGGMRLHAGESLTFTRNAGGENGGIRVTNFPALYVGDLGLSIADGRLQAVLSIHVEDYLLGVVPYEMNNLFPLEALKVQAIAARTYALRHQNASRAYDVVDTTNDQVFRGYLPGNGAVERAVAETRGVCGFYKGSLAQCYYSASNGGQTELVATVWPTEDDYGYYKFGDDPYDVENPASTVKSFELKKRYEADEAAPYALRKLLANQLEQELTSRGFDAAPESIHVNDISAVKVDKAAGGEGSKRMTSLVMTVSVSGRVRMQDHLTAEDLNAEEVYMPGLGVTPQPTNAPADDAADAAAKPETAPTPSPAPSYGPFIAIEAPFTLDIPIFPTAERAFSLDISPNYDNELWSIAERDDAYIVEARRYGHGVGMSQRGAEWMARQYGKSFEEILAFYYPGMRLMRYPESDRDLPYPEAALEVPAGPAPSPTPRPTLMPATLTAEEGQWYALVSGIDDDSSLNLRSIPDMSGDILMRLYKHQRLLVVERCAEDGWVKVRTDSIEGYVMESYLEKE